MARKEDYNWLEDPFDEKKATREQVQTATSNGTKLALGCGCLLAIVGIIVLVIFVGVNMIDILAGA